MVYHTFKTADSLVVRNMKMASQWWQRFALYLDDCPWLRRPRLRLMARGKGYFAGHWSAASAGMAPLCWLQLHSTQLIVFLWKVGGNGLWFRLLSHQVFFLSFHFSLFLLFGYILFFFSPCLNYPFIFAHCGQWLQRHFLIPSIATGAQEVMILQPGFLPFLLLIF